jgi:hypothetical protein
LHGAATAGTTFAASCWLRRLPKRNGLVDEVFRSQYHRWGHNITHFTVVHNQDQTKQVRQSAVSGRQAEVTKGHV